MASSNNQDNLAESISKTSSVKRVRLGTNILICERSNVDVDDCLALCGNNAMQRPLVFGFESLKPFSRPTNFGWFTVPEWDALFKALLACGYLPEPDDNAEDTMFTHCLNYGGTSCVMYKCDTTNPHQLENEKTDFINRNHEMIFMNVKINGRPHGYTVVFKDGIWYFLPSEEGLPIAAMYNPVSMFFTAEGLDTIRRHISQVYEYEQVSLEDPLIIAPSRSLNNNVDRFPIDAISQTNDVINHLRNLQYGSVGVDNRPHGEKRRHVQVIDLNDENVVARHIMFLDNKPEDSDGDEDDV